MALADESDTPRFSRHVAGVFSKLGCNSGGCHGAVNGQNGFRLTLFAGDPTLDHQRLLRDVGGRRLNFNDPERSLLLLKATGEISNQLIRKILNKWIFETGGAQRVALKVKGLKYKTLQQFKNFLVNFHPFYPLA